MESKLPAISHRGIDKFDDDDDKFEETGELSQKLNTLFNNENGIINSPDEKLLE